MTAPDGRHAQVIPRQYPTSGRAFFTVECAECLVVLNSGHHYRSSDLDHAWRLAAQHDAVHHADRKEPS